MILRKSILRQMKEKKFQYAGVIILLLVSIMLYVSLSMAISTLDNRNGEFRKSYLQEDFHFIVANPINDEQLKQWEENYQLKLEKRIYADVDFQQGATIRLLSLTNKVDKPYISEGRLPEKDNEVALSPVFAKEQDVKVGDKVTLNGQDLQVTGMVYLPDYIYILKRESDLINDPKNFGIGVTNENTITSITSKVVPTVLGDQATNEKIKSLKKDIAAEYSLLKWLNAEENPRIQFVESEIEGARATITTLPLFVLALSVMMVLMILKRRIELQRKEIGTLMAFGYRKGELKRQYISQAGLIGIIGTILGLLTGVGLSIPISDAYSNYYNLPSISYFDWDPKVFVIALLIPNVVLLGMTYVVIRKPLKQAPLTLLRPQEIMVGKKSFFERLAIFQKGSFISRFRIRLLVRSKSRAVYIILGVMFSTILLIFGFITYKAMDDVVDTTYKNVLTYNYAVYYKALQTIEVDEGESPFTVSEVKVEQINGELTKKSDEKAMIYGIRPETDQVHLLNDEDVSMNDQTSEGFVISQPLATILGVEKGDRLTVINAFNDQELTKEIVGVSTIYIGKSIYFQKPSVNAFLGYPEEVYTGKWSSEKPEDSQDILFVVNQKEVIENFESLSSFMRYSVIGISVFAIGIGVIVLSLLTNLIVEENAPSISLFKVMGYKDNEISKLVVNVYTPIVLLAYFLSIPLAVISIEQMMNSLVEQTGFTLPVQLTWQIVLLGSVIIMVTYYTSLFFSRKKIRTISLQEALKKQQD